MPDMGIYHPKTSKHWWGHFQYQGQRQFVNLGIAFRGLASDKSLAESTYYKRRDEFIKAVDSGQEIHRKLTFKAIVQEFMELWAKPNKKSWKNDEQILKRFLAYFGEDIHPKRITPHGLERYKAERTKEVSGPRCNRELATLKVVFSKAVLWGRVQDNPVKRIQMFPENQNRERFLSSKEKDALLSKSGWMKSILQAALKTGMRQGEILALKWADVNLDQNELQILNSKSGKKRFIPLNADMAEILKRHPKRGIFVFTDDEGRCLSRHGFFRTAFESLVAKLAAQGTPHFVFHDLRHTFGSDLAMKGVDAVTIKDLMGHSSLRMTERYMHLAPSHKRIAVELLNSPKPKPTVNNSVNLGYIDQAKKRLKAL